MWYSNLNLTHSLCDQSGMVNFSIKTLWQFKGVVLTLTVAILTCFCFAFHPAVDSFVIANAARAVNCTAKMITGVDNPHVPQT